jgi:hypothetical protein
MTSLAELERYLAEEAERLPSEGHARARHLAAQSGRRQLSTSLPFGVSVGTAVFAVLLTLFAIPALWVGLTNQPVADVPSSGPELDRPLAGSESNPPDLSTAAEGQITAEALADACPNCDDGEPVFIVSSLYESGSPLSEFVQPMSGMSVESISAVLPDAVFVEENTDEAASAYEIAGSHQATVVTFSPVTYPTATSATVSVGVIWGTSVTETPVEFHWDGSDWIKLD